MSDDEEGALLFYLCYILVWPYYVAIIVPHVVLIHTVMMCMCTL